MDFYSASSLKQQSAGRYVAPPQHIILTPNQLVFVHTPLTKPGEVGEILALY